MNDKLLPLNLPLLLISLLTQVGAKGAFKFLLSMTGLRTEVKAALVVQEVKEITEDILKKEVVTAIMNRGMKDSVLVALQIMGL